MITTAQVERGVQAALTLAKELAPLASLAGPTGAAIGTAIVAAADAADAVIGAIETDATIIANGDISSIKALQAQLAAQRHAFVATLRP